MTNIKLKSKTKLKKNHQTGMSSTTSQDFNLK